MSSWSSSMVTREVQGSGMLSRDQMVHLFTRFSYLVSQPDAKKRIADAVNDKHEAVAATTALQEEILLGMGIDPGFGLACLGKVNMIYENDQDLVVRFYRFIADEERACEEAELGPDKFAENIVAQNNLHKKQLGMLKQMRKFHLNDQYAILEKLHEQMVEANFEDEASILSGEKIQDIVGRRISPVYMQR